MIKKLKISLFMIVLSLVFIGGVNSARAAALTWSSDTNITINSNPYIIAAGSEATSVVLNTATTTLTVVVPALSTFTLKSMAGSTLTNDLATAETCSSGVGSVSYTGAGTIVFTPSAVLFCGSTGSTGGGSSSDTTAPTGTSVSISAGATSTTSTTVNLTLAATGASHMMIANDSAFTSGVWETYATTKAWTLSSGDGTKTVYVKFKDTAGNISTAVSDTITLSGTGSVAPVVTVEGCLAGYLFSSTTGASCGTTVTTTSTTTTYNFSTTTLRNGSRGEAVKELQRFLNATMNLGLVVDGIFGPKTTGVMKKWQTDHSLVVDGLVGPKTKAKMLASL
jgi:hypothetical protein